MRQSLADAKINQARDSENQAKADKDNTSTKSQLAEDQNYLATVKQQCADRETEHNAQQASRAAELEAVDKAISILTNPDMQAATGDQLGAKGWASFMQMEPDARSEAADAIQQVARKYKVVQLAQLAVRVRDGPFDKVMGTRERMGD